MESAECKGNATFHGALSFGHSFHEREFSRSEKQDFLRKIEKNDGHLIRKEMSKLWNKAGMGVFYTDLLQLRSMTPPLDRRES